MAKLTLCLKTGEREVEILSEENDHEVEFSVLQIAQMFALASELAGRGKAAVKGYPSMFPSDKADVNPVYETYKRLLFDNLP